MLAGEALLLRGKVHVLLACAQSWHSGPTLDGPQGLQQLAQARETLMKRLIGSMILMCASALAVAGDTIRIDNRIVTTGMSTAEVIDRAGQASRTVQLENVYGAGVGERWEYYRGSKQYSIWMSGGKVVKVDES